MGCSSSSSSSSSGGAHVRGQQLMRRLGSGSGNMRRPFMTHAATILEYWQQQ